MSTRIATILLALVMTASPALRASDSESGGYTLQWETAGFANPESVIYDAARHILYVTNVNGPPAEKDGNGSISRLAPDGSMVDAEWITGLDAPKGMAIVGGSLFVADIDAVIEIDVATGTVANRYYVEGAQFLNDVTADAAGAVFVSDSFTNTIHRLSEGRLGTWLSSPDLNGPNGLLVEADRMIVGSFGATEKPGQLLAVALADKSITSLSNDQPFGNLDGVERSAADTYLVTDWVGGKVYRVGPDGAPAVVLELTQGSADIDYVAGRGMLYVPRMMDNKVEAYSAPH